MRRITQQNFEECDNFAVLRHNAANIKEAERLYGHVEVMIRPRELFLHQTEKALKVELMLCKGLRQEILSDVDSDPNISASIAAFYQPHSGPKPTDSKSSDKKTTDPKLTDPKSNDAEAGTVTLDMIDEWCAERKTKFLVLGQSDCGLCVLIQPLLRSMAGVGVCVGYYNLSENDFPESKSIPICRTSPTLLIKASEKDCCVIENVGDPQRWLSSAAVEKAIGSAELNKLKQAYDTYWLLWDDYLASRLAYSRTLVASENVSDGDLMAETEDQAILEELCQVQYQKEDLDSANERLRTFKENVVEDIAFLTALKNSKTIAVQ